jgi:peptide/nickel transport system substrate-binding protein
VEPGRWPLEEEHVTEDRRLDGLVSEYVERRISRRTFMKRAAAMGVVATSAAAILAACQSATPTATGSAPASVAPGSAAPTPGGEVTKGGTFIEGYDRDFSPITTNNAAWVDPTHEALLEPLVRPDPAGVITPMLAESWESNEDATEWRFKLRSGLTFHSGEPVTAAAVVASFDIARGATGQHPQWWTQVTGVSAEGDDVVVVTCDKPYFTFLDAVARQEFANVYNVDTATAAGADYGVTVVDGTGPFELQEFQPGSHVLASRWDEYPGPGDSWFENEGPAHLDAVRWVPLLEAANRANELLSGNVHAIKRPLPSDLEALTSNPDVVVVESEESAGVTFGLNFERTELGFDDLRVRQAISHAINRQAIVDTILLGHGVPAYGPFPSKYKWYEPQVEQFNQFDTARAQELLEEAGWVAGGDGVRAKDGQRLSFEIINMTDAVRNQAGDAIVAMLADVGVEARMSNLEAGAFFDGLGKPETQAFFFQWLWMSPPNLLQVITDSRFRPAPNWEKANVPAVDAAIDKWQFATSEAEAEAAAREIQLVIAENLPTLTIFTPNVIWAHSAKVHGWTPTDSNLYPYYNDVWMES